MIAKRPKAEPTLHQFAISCAVDNSECAWRSFAVLIVKRNTNDFAYYLMTNGRGLIGAQQSACIDLIQHRKKYLRGELREAPVSKNICRLPARKNFGPTVPATNRTLAYALRPRETTVASDIQRAGFPIDSHPGYK